jgi:hypothetical protein
VLIHEPKPGGMLVSMPVIQLPPGVILIISSIWL